MGVESRNIILLLDLFSKGRLAVQVIQPQYNRIITTTKSCKDRRKRDRGSGKARQNTFNIHAI